MINKKNEYDKLFKIKRMKKTNDSNAKKSMRFMKIDYYF